MNNHLYLHLKRKGDGEMWGMSPPRSYKSALALTFQVAFIALRIILLLHLSLSSGSLSGSLRLFSPLSKFFSVCLPAAAGIKDD